MLTDDQSKVYNLDDIKPLTEERARQWLQHPLWTRHEAILILAGDDPESPRYYYADGASGMTTAFNLNYALPSADGLPPAEYIAWAEKWHANGRTKYQRLQLPDALQAALKPAATAIPKQTAQTPAPVQTAGATAPVVTDDEWKTKAQTRARELVKECRELDRYPSQANLGDMVAAEFRKAGIVGTDGKPLSGAYIKRHALKGISSAIGKQLSTTIGRGK